jgi:hypothetical protein
MFRLSSISGAALAGVFAAVFATTVAAQNATTDIGTLDKEAAEKAFPAKPPYSPYAGRNFPRRPYFGDTHLHTSYSMDAGAFGARLGPKDAYRFAKGEEVIASSGQRAKLSRPLDFPRLERSEEDYVVRQFRSRKCLLLSDRCAIRRIVDWFRSPITSDVQQPTTAPHPRAAVARPELFSAISIFTQHRICA